MLPLAPDVAANCEILVRESNYMYQQIRKDLSAKNERVDYVDTMLQVIRNLDATARAAQKTLVFKASTTILLRNPRLLRGLKSMGVRFAMIYRENFLDKCICNVRDCFGTGAIGYPVYADNGTRSELCFARRKLDDKAAIKAYMTNSTQCVVNYKGRVQQMKDKFADVIVAPSQAVSTDALFAFEFAGGNDEDKLETSKKAWMDLLTPILLRDRLDETAVLGFLRQNAGTRPPPRPHSDTIYNPSDVLEELASANLSSYFRTDEINSAS